MGLIGTLPYTFANGQIADATQVNANFAAITAVVDGAISATNLADGAVTLAKLATSVLTIEEIHFESSDAAVTYSTNPTTVISHSITLAASRYCLILCSSTVTGSPLWLYDDASVINTGGAVDGTAVTLFHYLQLAAGTHVIKTGIIIPAATASYNRLLIVQFAF